MVVMLMRLQLLVVLRLHMLLLVLLVLMHGVVAAGADADGMIKGDPPLL